MLKWALILGGGAGLAYLAWRAMGRPATVQEAAAAATAAPPAAPPAGSRVVGLKTVMAQVRARQAAQAAASGTGGLRIVSI